MKKLLRYGDCFVLLAAIIACMLRLWFDNSGLDGRGLYVTGHPAWILLCILSIGTIVFIWFMTKAAGDNNRYADNFSPSLVSTINYLLLAIGLGYVGITQLLDATELLTRLTALATMASAVMLAVTGIERQTGNRPAFFLHLVPSITFALRMFTISKNLGTEPEICKFIFEFFSSVTMTGAFFYLWAFDVDMASRRASLFWSLSAAFFSLVAAFEDFNNWVIYMLFASFLLANLCKLKYLPAPATEAVTEPETVPTEAPASPVETTPEETCATSAEVTAPTADAAAPTRQEAPPIRPRAVLHADIDPEADMDAFLADIKLFLENEDY